MVRRLSGACLAGLAGTLLALVGSAPVLAVSATDLVEHGAQYDGQIIEYQGEVIGEVMRRGRNAVLNVHDGTYALGVWVPARASAVITRVGRHSVEGDVVKVRGTFHRACLEHGGDTDLHGEALTVVIAGREVREPFRRTKALFAAFLMLVALGLAGWERARGGHTRRVDLV